MAGSDPEHQDLILAKLEEEGVVAAESMQALKKCFGMDAVSMTKFKRALGSLTHNTCKVTVRRRRDIESYGPHPIRVSLVVSDEHQPAQTPERVAS